MKPLTTPQVIVLVSVIAILAIATFFYLRSNQYEPQLLEQSQKNLAMFPQLSNGQTVKENYGISADCRYGRGFRMYAIPQTDTENLCQQLKTTLEENNYSVRKVCTPTPHTQDNVKEIEAVEKPPKGVADNWKTDNKVIELKIRNLQGDTISDFPHSYFNAEMHGNKAFWQDKTLIAVYSKIYLDTKYYNGTYVTAHKGKCYYTDYDMVTNTVTHSEH